MKSFSYFVLNKPFYITSPTNTEMEMCMCGNWLNPHCLYAVIRKRIDMQLPHSLSEFLCMNMKCNKETKTSFYHLDCILGKCRNKCSIVTDLKSCISKHPRPKQGEENFLLSYVFEKVMTNYFNKKS